MKTAAAIAYEAELVAAWNGRRCRCGSSKVFAVRAGSDGGNVARLVPRKRRAVSIGKADLSWCERCWSASFGVRAA